MERLAIEIRHLQADRGGGWRQISSSRRARYGLPLAMAATRRQRRGCRKNKKQQNIMYLLRMVRWLRDAALE